MWRVRALLHVHAGTAQEILTFDEQVWLAQHFGYQDQPHLLAVEQFMQQYYQHTMGLHERCARFIERCRPVSLWRRITEFFPAPRVDEYFVVRGGVLSVADEHRAKVLDSPALQFRLFDLAREKQLTIAPPLLEDIHRHVDTVSVEAYRTPEVSRTFLKIMAGPGTTPTLEAMHRAHLLEKLVPAMGTVRGLMQFNQYHKYTVDEHTLLTIRNLERLATTTDPYRQRLRNVLNELPEPELLVLSLLLHDVGKLLIPAEILRKPGRLTADEMALVREHPRAGLDLVEGGSLASLAKVCILGHHERLDGRGYPDGRGGNIVLHGARLLGLADAWDAMTSDSPYRKAMPQDEVRRLVRADSGKHFDPKVVEAFMELKDLSI